MPTLAEVAQALDAEINGGDPTLFITDIAPIETAKKGQITHLSHRQYRKYLGRTQASAVVLREDDVGACPTASVVVDEPYVAYAKLTRLFDTRPRTPLGIHDTAIVDASANIGRDVRIGAYVTIGSEASIGDHVEIADHVSVAAGVKLGNNTLIKAGSVLSANVTLGHDCIVHESVVIGAEGFGFAIDRTRHPHSIAQLASVSIGDFVEIGAKSTVDRGALADTRIDNYVKLDDQCHVGHNCVIGENTIVSGCTGFAGSTQIGKNCAIGGGVGVAGDGPVSITDNVQIGSMTKVTRSITEPGVYSGSTLHDVHSNWIRNAFRFNQLDQIAKRLAALEAKFNE